jgi:hypothetical protein
VKASPALTARDSGDCGQQGDEECRRRYFGSWSRQAAVRLALHHGAWVIALASGPEKAAVRWGTRYRRHACHQWLSEVPFVGRIRSQLRAA